MTWNPIGVTGLPPDDDQSAFAADPDRQGRLFLGFETRGVYTTEIAVSTVTVADPTSAAAPAAVSARPNPFTHRTWFDVGAAEDAKARTLDVYDVAGRHVRRLVVDPGARGVIWGGDDMHGREGGRFRSPGTG